MRHKGIFKKILNIISDQKTRLILSVFLALISVVANLLGPWLIGKAIDGMLDIQAVNFSSIIQFLFAISLTYIVYSFSLYLLTICTNKIAYDTSHKLRSKLYKKLSTLSLKFYDTTPHGDIMSRFINDCDSVSDALLQSISTFLTGIIMIAGVVIFMLRLHILMAFIVILSAPLAYYAAKFITMKSKSSFQAQANILGELNGYAEEIISAQKVVQAFHYESKSTENFRAINGRLYNAGIKAQFYSSLTNPTTRVVNNIGYTVVGIVGAYLAINNSLSVGAISTFLLYANLFSKPFNEITGVIPQIQSAFASLVRIFGILEENEESEAKPLLEPVKFKGEVIFKNVSFSYDPDKTLISSLNLHIKPGQRVAIVGSTGAGKTTLINLLMRFYDIQEGTITIDGIDIYSIPRKNLRENFGMVLQDTWLFNGTIKENIAYAKADASEKEIIHSAISSGAHSFIKRLPKGYDTMISETSGNLSEGQKQLLAITRVMLTNPSILILDEATSNIDTITELHVQRAFIKMMEGKTSFIIAHRLSTIKDADLILVMEKGNVIESGTHAELLSKKGTYAKLYFSQFKND